MIFLVGILQNSYNAPNRSNKTKKTSKEKQYCKIAYHAKDKIKNRLYPKSSNK
ncbi:hypothetical protein J0E37_001320 [Campylobacter upsaliensis]|nr:hypothetical protein [Campylobacter upsaliensis]